MNSILNYNGILIPTSEKCISPLNQISQFGVFETIKYSNGKLKNLSDHFERLWSGIELLKINIPDFYKPEFFEAEIEKLLKSSEHKMARVRLSILNNSGTNSTTNVNFIIEASTIQPPQNKCDSSEFNISTYYEVGIMANNLSAIKTNNRLAYFLAKNFAEENNLNDALLINQYGRICDTSIANIFLIVGEKIITPPITEGCVAGVMRKNILKLLYNLGFTIKEIPVNIETINNADEIFLTNSIIGMQPVSNFNGRKLETKFTKHIYEVINNNSDLLF